MKRYFQIISNFTLAVSLTLSMFAGLPIKVSAAGTFNSYSDNIELESMYDSGAVIYIPGKTTIETTSYNTASFINATGDGMAGFYGIGGYKGQRIGLRINNCAYDKEGNLADIEIRTSVPEPYAARSYYDSLASALNVPKAQQHDGNTAEIQAKKMLIGMRLSQDSSGLLKMWLNTNCAAVEFEMTYYKSGTQEKINIGKATASIYDIDVSNTIPKNNGTYSDKDPYWCVEFVEFYNEDNPSIYYQRSSEGGYLYTLKTTDKIGLRVPSNSEYPIQDTNLFEKISSLTCAMDLSSKNTYRMRYGGYSCGICFFFASVFPFKESQPTLYVSKDKVRENETFDYYLVQKIPSNYYASTLKFMSSAKLYESINIENEITDDNVEILSDQIQYFISPYFTYSIQDEKLIPDMSYATEITTEMHVKDSSSSAVHASLDNSVNTNALTNPDYYGKFMVVKIPAKFIKGAGLNTSGYTNIADTQFNLTGKTGEKNSSNSVITSLYYMNTTQASIENGSLTIKDDGADKTPSSSQVSNTYFNHGETCTRNIVFNPNLGYKVKKVLVDDVEVEYTKTESGYELKEDIVDTMNQDSNHEILVETELLDSQVIVHYVDSQGNKLSEDTVKNGKVFSNYTTSEKEIPYYTLKHKTDNWKGALDIDPIEVVYTYERNTNNVVIRYFDDEGNELNPAETETLLNLPQGEAVKIDEDLLNKSFPNYSKVFTEGSSRFNSATGTISALLQDEEIAVIYSRNKEKIVVNYLEEGTDVPLKDRYETIKNEGMDIDLTDYLNVDIQYYHITSTSDPVSKEHESASNGYVRTITYNIYYARNKNSITLKYQDKEGNTLYPVNTITDLNQGESYTLEESYKVTIPYYHLIEIENEQIDQLLKDETITLIYERNKNSVGITYIDKETGAILESDTKADLEQGKEVDLKDELSKAFQYYTFSHTEAADGVDTDEKKIPVLTQDEQIKVYYQRNKNNVVINYLDESGKQISQKYEAKNISQGTDIDLTAYIEVEIPYYTKLSVSQSPVFSPLTKDETVNVIFKRNKNSIVINYLDKETGESLGVVNKKNLDQGTDIDLTNEFSKSFPYYTYNSFTADAHLNQQTHFLSLVEDEEINIFHVRNKNNIAINYLEEETNLPLRDSVNKSENQGMGIDLNDDINIDIQYYTKTRVEADGHLDKITNQIDTLLENEEINVYYKRNKNTVEIHYIDEETSEELDSYSETFNQGENIDLTNKTSREFDYFDRTRIDGKETHYPLTEDHEIKVYYTRRKHNITVHYVDENGNPLAADSALLNCPEGKITDAGVLLHKEIEYYTKLQSTHNGYFAPLLKDETIDVVYRRNTQKITVNYIDKDTRQEVLPSVEVADIPQGSRYDFTELIDKEIDYYHISEISPATLPEIILQDTEVNICFTRNQSSLTINYIDTAGQPLLSPVHETFNQGDNIDVSDLISKEIKDYHIISISNSGSFSPFKKDEVIDVIYDINKYQIRINHIDSETKKPIADQEIIKDLPVGHTEDILSHKKALKNYTFKNANYDSAEIKNEDIEVSLYYSANLGEVTVKRIDQAGNELEPDEVITDYVGRNFQTILKEFPGYAIKEQPERISGTVTDEPQELTFIYEKKNCTIKSIYVDEDGNEIAKPEINAVEWGSEYSTSIAMVDGFSLKEAPSNSQGIANTEEILVEFVYKKVTQPPVLEKAEMKKATGVVTHSVLSIAIIGLLLGFLSTGMYLKKIR